MSPVILSVAKDQGSGRRVHRSFAALRMTNHALTMTNLGGTGLQRDDITIEITLPA
jgi:molybdopterin biosynthesis enzyme MoaB